MKNTTQFYFCIILLFTYSKADLFQVFDQYGKSQKEIENSTQLKNKTSQGIPSNFSIKSNQNDITQQQENQIVKLNKQQIFDNEAQKNLKIQQDKRSNNNDNPVLNQQIKNSILGIDITSQQRSQSLFIIQVQKTINIIQHRTEKTKKLIKSRSKQADKMNDQQLKEKKQLLKLNLMNESYLSKLEKYFQIFQEIIKNYINKVKTAENTSTIEKQFFKEMIKLESLDKQISEDQEQFQYFQQYEENLEQQTDIQIKKTNKNFEKQKKQFEQQIQSQYQYKKNERNQYRRIILQKLTQFITDLKKQIKQKHDEDRTVNLEIKKKLLEQKLRKQEEENFKKRNNDDKFYQYQVQNLDDQKENQKAEDFLAQVKEEAIIKKQQFDNKLKEINYSNGYEQQMIIKKFQNEVQKEREDRINKKIQTKKQMLKNYKEKLDGFRPIKIVFESSFFQQELQKLIQSRKIKIPNGFNNKNYPQFLLGKFQQILNKVDSIIKRFIKINEKEIPYQSIDNEFQCQSGNTQEFNFDQKNFAHIKNIEWLSDVTIFFSVFKNQNSSVLAYASSCQLEQGLNIVKTERRAQIGKIMFNLGTMNLNFDNDYEERQVIMTSVHEIFHILGFSSSLQNNFHERVIPQLHPHLNEIKNYWLSRGQNPKEYPFINHAHWNPNYFPNDLMSPYSNVYSEISTFTLEYLDLSHPNYLTNISTTQQNYFQSKYMNKDMYYKCKDNKHSDHPNFCSQYDYQNDRHGCSEDFNTKLQCSSQIDSYSRCTLRSGYSGNSLNQCNVFSPEKDQSIYEESGPQSKCFRMTPNSGTSCLKYKINHNKISIFIQNTEYICHQDDQQIEFQFQQNRGTYVSTMRCPKIKDFISVVKNQNCENNCNFNGICIEGKCDCFFGWSVKSNCSQKISNVNVLELTSFQHKVK